MRENRNTCKILVGKPDGKRQLGRPRHKWEDNIKENLKEILWERYELDSSSSGYGPVAGSCEHGNELFGSLKGG
jgi:hypothetical protein